MSPRDRLETAWISPEMLPAVRVGALLPTPGVLVELASCGDRAEVPQAHQIVDRHGEGEHPADAVAAAMPRLAKQPDRLEPSEHFLDPLAEALAHTVARVASRPRVEGGELLLRHVRGHVELYGTTFTKIFAPKTSPLSDRRVSGVRLLHSPHVVGSVGRPFAASRRMSRSK